MSDFLAALGLVLVIEGALYALFPNVVQTYLVRVMELPPAALQKAGIGACIVGLGIVWLVRG